MRHLLPCILACALFLLGGCFDDRAPVAPSVPGPIQTAPPATAAVDAAKQALIAGGANAKAMGNTAGEKAAAAGLKAEDTEGAISSLSPFYGLAVLFLIAAALLAYERNLKLAGLCLAGAGGAVVGPILVTGLLRHQVLVCWLSSLAILIVLTYHYRSSLKSMAAKGEADTEAMLKAFHLSSSEAVVAKVIAMAKADAEALLVKLHLRKAATLTSVPTAPPTPKPTVITTTTTSP